jgi:hypothetical protein
LLPEQFYENNIVDIPNYFLVNKDNVNPLIEVSFDGQFIFDGDIVSPSPLISMIMRDENTFLFKEDTVGVELFIKYPNNESYTRINFSDPTVQWIPANVNSNFEVQLRPQSLADGLYALRVQAGDVSGNLAGSNPYEINFLVVNESTITNFYPYPNPFSTSMRFIFTLTGAEIPDQIKIQIMTVSGKIVREITQDELGPIRIGNNVSDFFWDGRDEFGDQLANGVYLYRVLIRKNGQPMELRETKGDKAFKKGFGKIYLLK